MKIDIKPNNSTKYHIQLDSQDELYTSCVWATITLDHDSYTLYAETDCGNYTYGWLPTSESESFLKLMSRIDREYLLRKIANESVFNLKKSKESTIKNIADYWNDHGAEFTQLCSDINEIEDCGEECFFRQADDIMRNYEINDTFELIDCVKEFPNGAKTFARIFCEVLQPQLKKQLQEG